MPATFASRAAIDQTAIERDWLEIVNLFLRQWFDGGTHTVDAGDPATVDLVFPAVSIYLFGTEPLPKETPAGAAHFHTILTANEPIARHRRGQTLATKVIRRRLRWSHYVRVPHQGNDEHAAAFKAMAIADRLTLLYEHAPVTDLARKNLQRLKVTSGPVEMPMPGYAVRLLAIEAEAFIERTMGG